MISTGLRALAIEMPRVVRTNTYFAERHPAVLLEERRRTLARVFENTESSDGSRAFDVEMERYLRDPFRGTVERRALGDGESPLSLEEAAARKAITAAGLDLGDIDLIIGVSFLPENLGIGDAVFLAKRLDVRCPVWNLESTCTGALHALHTASALVAAGAYRTILVAVSCTYSRVMDEADTLSWFLGDGAGAFVVSAVPNGEGLIGFHSVNTADTCGAFLWELAKDAAGAPRIVVRAGKDPGRALRDTSAPVLRACCESAARAASVGLGDIALFVCNTPVAWYSDFFARALGIERDRTLSTYTRYANIGPALLPVNLFHAAHEGRLRKGDLVLVYSVGTVSSAGAAVMRWGDVALGPPP